MEVKTLKRKWARAPAFSSSSGKVRYCSCCGKPFVFDDEV